jgi:hypothetical protein
MPDRAPARLKKLKQVRLANKHHVQGLDHAMTAGCGLGLQDFIGAAPPTRALKAHEQRYFVPVSDLPTEVAEASLGRVRRACVYDENAESTRLEYELSQENRTLVSWLDMGAIGWPSKYFLYMEAGVRGWFFPDHAHRRWDSFHNSLGVAGIAFVKNEAGLVASLGSAPWGNCAHFCRYSEAASEYFENFDCSDPLFVTMYSRIVADWYGGDPPHNYGTAEHMAEMFQICASAEVFEKKGGKQL